MILHCYHKNTMDEGTNIYKYVGSTVKEEKTRSVLVKVKLFFRISIKMSCIKNISSLKAEEKRIFSQTFFYVAVCIKSKYEVQKLY